MKIILYVVIYVMLSVLLYLLASLKCEICNVFKAPKSKVVYYLLTLTWGLPSVLLGGIVGIILLICGYKPKKYGWLWYFEIPNIKWGLWLGLFFVAPSGYCESLKMHEHGHGIQNLYFGIFTPMVIMLPSAVRFWYREYRKAIGKPCTTKYDDIWFEKSASKSGKKLIQNLRERSTL